MVGTGSVEVGGQFVKGGGRLMASGNPAGIVAGAGFAFVGGELIWVGVDFYQGIYDSYGE